MSSISSVQWFVTYAQNYLNRWQIAVGHKISHSMLGTGIIEKVEYGSGDIYINSGNIYIDIHFAGDIKRTRRFSTRSLADFFYYIELPISEWELIEQICQDSQHKKTEEERKVEKQRRQEKILVKRMQLEQERKKERLRLRMEREEKERQLKLRLKLEHEEKERRLQAEHQERVRREEEKNAALRRLQGSFEKDFLNSYNFYQASCSDHISLEEYKTEKANYVQLWMKQHLNCEVDLEQAAAIAAVENHVQVIARAGSGKTATLVNRALFLQKHCGVAPSEMLLLAFNRKAVEEIRKRLSKELQESIPHIMTFHALGYALVQPGGKLLFDEPDGEQSKSRVMQEDVIAGCIRDPNYYGAIRALIMARFRCDWERIESGGCNKKLEELLRYRRSLVREAIDGTYVKSFGEKVIANFLFEHDIQYKYERAFKWSNGGRYRPDFTLEQHNVVIEYFGLQGDPDYDALSEGKRNYWRNNSEWRFLEFSPRTLGSQGAEAFCAHLKRSLEAYGVKCDRLSEEEIWRRIKDRTIDRFTKVVVKFVQRCRQRSLTPHQLSEIIRHYQSMDEVELQFLSLVQIFYRSYLKTLEATGEEDFDGWLQQAAQVITSGQTLFCRSSGTGDLSQLRYVFIDEYQDFSDLFYQVVAALRSQNPQAQFFCVGDDWQAINGFAGSDLGFYQQFEYYFPNPDKLQISTNYRSASEIVNASNVLMQGLGTPARPYQPVSGKVEIVTFESFQPTPAEREKHCGDSYTPLVLRLVRKIIQEGQEVVLLSRKNRLPKWVNYGQENSSSCGKVLDRFLKLIHTHLPEASRKAVSISTAHGYKGLEKQVVIILDAVPRSYPLLHPDWIFTRVLGDNIEQLIAEERRLFYVALTRAVGQVLILTEGTNRSPFLDDLEKHKKLPSLDWSKYLPVKFISAKVSNQNNRGSSSISTIAHLLNAEGYIRRGDGQEVWCYDYAARDFSIQQIFNQSQWIQIANGVKIQFYNEQGNALAIYHIDRGQCVCIFDNWEG